MKFLIFLFLCIATCLESVLAAKKAHIACVMVNSSIVHKCDAFFVTAKEKDNLNQGSYLVTTASCVSRSRNYVVGVGEELIGQKQLFYIEEIIIHPNYSAEPDMYNIAIVRINGTARDVFVYELMNDLDYYYGTSGLLHLWRFVGRDYLLTENKFIYVSNAIYERATNEELGVNEIGIMALSPVTSGFYDVGTPFTAELTTRNKRKSQVRKPYILGFLVKPHIGSETMFLSLYSIPFYYSWIAAQLKNPKPEILFW